LQKRKIARKKEKQRTGEGGGASNSLRDLDGERAGFTKIDQDSMGWKKKIKKLLDKIFGSTIKKILVSRRGMHKLISERSAKMIIQV
jgi:hypothetical protein